MTRLIRAFRSENGEPPLPPSGGNGFIEPNSTTDAPPLISPAERAEPTPTQTATPTAAETPMPETPKPETTEEAAASQDAAPAAAITVQPDTPALSAAVSSVNIGAIGVGLGALALLLAVLSLLGARRRKRRRERAREERMRHVCPTEKIPEMQPEQRHVSGFAVGNAHHIGRRENQEDAFAISDLSNATFCREQGVLAVVADGMGGLEGGEIISAAVTAGMLRGFAETTPSRTPAQKLLQLAYEASAEANRVTGGMPGQSGSTLVAVLLQGDRLWFISVGDSRITLFRNGGAIQLTREHIYEAELDVRAARGLVSFEAANADRQRKALTSYMGMGEPAYIDRNIRPIQLQKGDTVLLMSDGVFNALSDAELAQAIDTDNVHEAAERIERAVLGKQNPHQDNLTAIVLRML